MNISHERVLCFPRSLFERIGSFQGFKPDDGSIVKEVLTGGQVRFVARLDAEENPSLKQFIPYVVMRYGNKLLYYVRGKQSGELRLQGLGSVGIGGHISVTDHGLFSENMEDVFWEGLRREVAEEIEVQTEYRPRVLGLINDDSNPVGAVHLGVLVEWELVEPRIRKKEQAITTLEFLSIEQLNARRDTMETWSQIVIDNWAQIDI